MRICIAPIFTILFVNMFLSRQVQFGFQSPFRKTEFAYLDHRHLVFEKYAFYKDKKNLFDFNSS